MLGFEKCEWTEEIYCNWRILAFGEVGWLQERRGLVSVYITVSWTKTNHMSVILLVQETQWGPVFGRCGKRCEKSNRQEAPGRQASTRDSLLSCMTLTCVHRDEIQSILSTLLVVLPIFYTVVALPNSLEKALKKQNVSERAVKAAGHSL